MKFISIILILSSIAACSNAKNTSDAIEEQRQIYKSWVLSRCMASVVIKEEDKEDALNSASAYLEISKFSIEDLTAAKPLIEKFVSKKYQGSVPGTFNTKKCIDLFYSQELEILFNEKYKNII
jgi:hypothetical protein